MHTNDIGTIKRVAFVVGCVGLAVSGYMTFMFGYATSFGHAMQFLCVTVLASIIFPARSFFKGIGWTWAARAYLLLGVIFLSGEFFADLGYTIGQRDKSLSSAGHQQMAFTDSRDNVDEIKRKLAVFEANLTELNKANAWATTVSADGLKEKLNSAQMAIDQEAARGGCKSKCLALTKDRDELASRIKTAESKTKLEAQIDATNKKLEELRGEAKITKPGHTPVKSQTDFVGKLWLAWGGADADKALKPDSVTLGFTEIFIGFFIALLATLLPAVCFHIAFADIKEAGSAMLSSGSQQVAGAAVASRDYIAEKTAPTIKRLEGLVPMRNQETLEIFRRKIQAAA